MIPHPDEIRQMRNRNRLLGVDVALLSLSAETSPRIHVLATADGATDPLEIMRRMMGLEAMAEGRFKSVPPFIRRATIALFHVAPPEGESIALAYGADKAEDVGGIPEGWEDHPEVKMALRRHRRRQKRHYLRLLVKWHIVRHWVDRNLCDMTEAELAQHIRAEFRCRFTPPAAKKIRERLGLRTIRLRGRKPSDTV